MNRFDSIIENFVKWGNGNDLLYAALIIGSQARDDHPADDFSDLDLIMVVEDPHLLLQSDGWLGQIGNYRISFAENTLGGGKERRVIFDGGLDVDFVMLSRNHLDNMVRNWEIGILRRGYSILINKIGIDFQSYLTPDEKPAYRQMSEYEFNNLIQNFWFHAVWSAKKLDRGEIWTAKVCIDAYM